MTPAANHDWKMTSMFERYLTVWVALCIALGIMLGKVAPQFAKTLDGMSIRVNGAPVVSIPIAICVFFLGFLFKGFIGAEAMDLVKLPFGLDLLVGAVHGAGTVVLQEGVRMLEIPLWRSYFAGCILLGIAPCTAMVLAWGYLARGNDGLTLVMVAINSLTMLVLYGVLGGVLGVGKLPIPWQALLLSAGVYVALPLGAGYLSRIWIIHAKGEAWFKEKFLHVLTPVTIAALLLTLVLLFSFVVGVLIEVPVMLMLVGFCKKTIFLV